MDRMIAIVGAFDQNGVYGIGSHMPWENKEGKSAIVYDLERFLVVTRDTAPEGKKNVLIAGRSTAETMMRPLSKRRMIIVSNTLSEDEANAGRSEKVTVARGVKEALDKAVAFEDCGHIFFIGGKKIWRLALMYHFCTHAFITVIKCDTVAKSLYTGNVHIAPEMLLDETFSGMKIVESIPLDDKWGEDHVDIEFRNYTRT